MSSRSQAHWFRSRYRYRFVDDEGDKSAWRYADTLEDVRTDLTDTDDVFEVEVERHVRADDFKPYGTFIWGEHGISLTRTGA